MSRLFVVKKIVRLIPTQSELNQAADHSLLQTTYSHDESMKQRLPGTTHPSMPDHIETAVMYSIFFLTGAAVVLPGTLLPLLSRRWHMGDGTAGIFFLCFSCGSSCGALLSRGKLHEMLAAGCAMVSVSALLLGAHVTGGPLFLIALYGCGLGLAMTSISLLRSRRWSQRRILEFARLNLIWALGAGVAPAILLRSASRFNTALLLRATAAIFCLFAALVFLTVRSVPCDREASVAPGSASGVQSSPGWLRTIRAVPPVLLCLIPLATGVESGVSSWLSSYIMRGGNVLSVTISATTAFGAGLIASRLIYSHPSAAAPATRIVLRLHPVCVVLGISLLMLSHAPLLSVAAAFLVGFGVGPMYPLVLALLLSHNEAGNAGFLAGGLGASLVPMITGAVSSWTHSLRTGLSVLLAAASLMLVFGTQLARRTTQTE
jgi:fucose permease